MLRSDNAALEREKEIFENSLAEIKSKNRDFKDKIKAAAYAKIAVISYQNYKSTLKSTPRWLWPEEEEERPKGGWNIWNNSSGCFGIKLYFSVNNGAL